MKFFLDNEGNVKEKYKLENITSKDELGSIWEQQIEVYSKTKSEVKKIQNFPNQRTFIEFQRQFRARGGNTKMQEKKYHDFVGKLFNQLKVHKQQTMIIKAKLYRRLTVSELGMDLKDDEKKSVDAVSKALAAGILKHINRPTPTNIGNIRGEERQFINLQFDLIEKVVDKGSTSSIDETLFNGFKDIFDATNGATKGATKVLTLDGIAKPLNKDDPIYKNNYVINNAAVLNSSNHKNHVACPLTSIVDAMPQCTYNSARINDKLAIHDMVFEVSSRNKVQYLGYSNLNKNKTIPKLSLGFHIAISKDFVVSCDKVVDYKTGKELAAASVYKNVLDYIASNFSQGVSLEAHLKNPTLLSNFLSCICLKGVGDFFQEINSLLKDQGRVNTAKKPTSMSEIFIGVGNDRPSAVRAMALAKFHLPKESDVNKESYVGFKSSANDYFLKATSIHSDKKGGLRLRRNTHKKPVKKHTMKKKTVKRRIKQHYGLIKGKKVKLYPHNVKKTIGRRKYYVLWKTTKKNIPGKIYRGKLYSS